MADLLEVSHELEGCGRLLVAESDVERVRVGADNVGAKEQAGAPGLERPCLRGGDEAAAHTLATERSGDDEGYDLGSLFVQEIAGDTKVRIAKNCIARHSQQHPVLTRQSLEAAAKILALLNQARDRLGINRKAERKLYDMKDRRELKV